jgi:type I restriction enzyme S subunit
MITATDEMVKSQFIEMFGSNDCECKPLSDLTSLITKGTTPTSVGFNFEEDGIKYIKAENICEDTSINLNDCMHISQDCHNTLKRSQLQNGDLLFSIAGVIGRVGVITKECLPANTNQALAIIRFDTSKEINKEYAKHALLSPFVESQWKMKMRGAAQMNISLKDVGDINIPLPSLANQEQFCQIAEQADKSKFELRKSIDAIDAVIKSLING